MRLYIHTLSMYMCNGYTRIPAEGPYSESMVWFCTASQIFQVTLAARIQIRPVPEDRPGGEDIKSGKGFLYWGGLTEVLGYPLAPSPC